MKRMDGNGLGVRAGLIGRAGLGVLVSCAGLSFGQNALGDGRALDNGLGSGGRYNYQRPSFTQELQFRNAIVTGNAPGGLSFRGDLGYRAAGEFSGSLGSDELFSFRRDSLYSGLAGMGIRGTDALQYQFSLTTGARPPSNLVGGLSVSRDGGSVSSGTLGRGSDADGTVRFESDPSDARGLNLYRPSAYQQPELADAITGTLRSSSSYTTTANLSPVVLSVYREGIEQNQYGLTASPLTGLIANQMKTEEDASDPTLPRDPAGQRVRTAYDELVSRIRERAAAQALNSGNPDDAGDESIAERIQRMRMEMLGLTPAAQDDASDPAGVGDQGQPGEADGTSSNPGSLLGGDEGSGDDGADDASGGVTGRGLVDPASGAGGTLGGTSRADLRDAFRLDESTLDLIRDSGVPIRTLIDPDAASRDVYTEHMRAGERLIAGERYFDAEERFARALAMRPGDQSAQIGRVHAQLGAGLVLSAAVNLRQLLISNPEMMGVRYIDGLLPSGERVDGLISIFRVRAGLVEGEGSEEDVGVRRSAALLLAYLGYQNHRVEVVRDGLDVLDEIGAEDDRRFAGILRQVWLGTMIDSDEPTEDSEPAGVGDDR